MGPTAHRTWDGSGVGPDPTPPATACVAGVASPAISSALPPGGFPPYDLARVSEEQTQQWADEAEAGYDVEEIKRRGRGRPGRGAEPMQVVAIRLTAEELAALDAIAKREKISRSEAIRRALAGFAA